MHLHIDCSDGVSLSSLLAAALGTGNTESRNEWAKDLECFLREQVLETVRLEMKTSSDNLRSAANILRLVLSEDQQSVTFGQLEEVLAQNIRKNEHQPTANNISHPLFKSYFAEKSKNTYVPREDLREFVLVIGIVWCFRRLSIRSTSCGVIPLPNALTLATKACATENLAVSFSEDAPHVSYIALDFLNTMVTSPSTAGPGRSPPITIAKVARGRGSDATNSPMAIIIGNPLCQPQNSADVFSRLSKLVVIEANVDDCTPEHLSFCADLVLKNGAKDAWITPIVMKKGRAAHTLSCLCEPDRKERLLEVIFRNSSTIGARVYEVDRVALRRTVVKVSTKWTENELNGEIGVKIAYLGQDILSMKAEFDHCKTIALSTQEPLQAISDSAIHLARLKLENR